MRIWRALGVAFDLLYFWTRFLAADIKRFENCTSESQAKELAQLLKPFLRKGRDLCCHVQSLYEAMHFAGPYRSEFLASIEVAPRPSSDCYQLALIRKWLPRFGSSVVMLHSSYIHLNEFFEQAVGSAHYGDRAGAPSNLHMLELDVRSMTGRMKEFLSILNDLHRGAGYEVPFQGIPEDRGETGE